MPLVEGAAGLFRRSKFDKLPRFVNALWIARAGVWLNRRSFLGLQVSTACSVPELVVDGAGWWLWEQAQWDIARKRKRTAA